MIISASRRTDIPAFYSRWLMHRLRKGYVDVANPFNPAGRKRIDLRPEAVDAIVFWTRFPARLLGFLPEIDSRGYRYYFLFTITGYPTEFEPNLPSKDRTIEIFRRLSDLIGPERVIWRYDPIILSSKTDSDFHLRNFESISGRLKGAAKTVKISFLDFYKKTERRMQKLSADSGIEWLRTGSNASLLESLARIAESHGMTMQTCAEEMNSAIMGISAGSCIDYALINRLFSRFLRYHKDRSQRKACLCGPSVDIGAYNTCGFRCIYCYATASFETAARNLKKVDPESTSLDPVSEELHEKAEAPNPSA